MQSLALLASSQMSLKSDHLINLLKQKGGFLLTRFELFLSMTIFFANICMLYVQVLEVVCLLIL